MLARYTTMSLRWRLELGAPFQPPAIRPLVDRRHLENAVRYAFKQEPHHGIVLDPFHDASSLPDLVGLRALSPATVGRFSATLPRVTKTSLLEDGGLALGPMPSRDELPATLLEATLAAAGLATLGLDDASHAARCAAAHAVSLPAAELGGILQIAPASVRRLRDKQPLAALLSATRPLASDLRSGRAHREGHAEFNPPPRGARRTPHPCHNQHADDPARTASCTLAATGGLPVRPVAPATRENAPRDPPLISATPSRCVRRTARGTLGSTLPVAVRPSTAASAARSAACPAASQEGKTSAPRSSAAVRPAAAVFRPAVVRPAPRLPPRRRRRPPRTPPRGRAAPEPLAATAGSRTPATRRLRPSAGTSPDRRAAVTWTSRRPPKAPAASRASP
jgi:hypothetical protein